jgi:L-ascorbate metabolism protein UlaG (beta-lactamase superfamily)
MRLALIGHMTVRIESDGVTLLTDPWFGPASRLERRLAPLTVPLHLHCAGKWLDRDAGLSIEMDNAPQVDAGLQRWAGALESQGLGVKLLVSGEPWDLGAGA